MIHQKKTAFVKFCTFTVNHGHTRGRGSPCAPKVVPLVFSG